MLKSFDVEDRVCVVIEVGGRTDHSWLTVGVDRTSLPVHVAMEGPFLVTADYVRLVGAQPRVPTTDTLVLRATGSDSEPFLELDGTARGMVVEMEGTMSNDGGDLEAALTDRQIPISKIEFVRPDAQGQRRSTLIGHAVLRYPDLAGAAERQISLRDFLVLGGLRGGRIKGMHIVRSDGRSGLRLHLDTTASTIRIGTPDRALDGRTTWFDRMWHDQIARWLFAVVAWLMPTSIAVYRLWMEVRGTSEQPFAVGAIGGALERKCCTEMVVGE